MYSTSQMCGHFKVVSLCPPPPTHTLCVLFQVKTHLQNQSTSSIAVGHQYQHRVSPTSAHTHFLPYTLPPV